MNDVTLKEYVESVVGQERELRLLQFKDTERALDLARRTMESRLDSMNELRAQINSERGMFPSRDLCDRMMNTMEARVRALENFKSNIEGRILVIGGSLLLLQIIIAAATLLLKK